MRRAAIALILSLAVCLPALAAEPAAKNSPALDDVLEYVRLFGYREMLEQNAERQLAAIVDAAKGERPDVDPRSFEVIRQEMQAELRAASERAARDMAGVLQRRLSREDVAFLLGIGRDPRMQRVVKLQPKIAEDLEGIGERLAEDIAGRAAPRIMQRLSQPQGPQEAQPEEQPTRQPERQTL
jgi:hypothetical protein